MIKERNYSNYEKIRFLTIVLIIMLVFSTYSGATGFESYNKNDRKYDVFLSDKIFDLIGKRIDYLFSVNNLQWIDTTLSTPNTENSVPVMKMLNDLDESDIGYLNNIYDIRFTEAERISFSSAKYNCHSYAWYSQNVSTNTYWMSDPSQYINDNSCRKVTTPQPGDIICYMDDNLTPNNLSDDIIIHSGIVTEVLSGQSNGLCGTADKVTVTSKWGMAGLYVHNGYDCPYTSIYGADSPSDMAEYVNYYRLHTYTEYDSHNGLNHYQICEECGYRDLHSHDYDAYIYQNEDQHWAQCTKCMYSHLEGHIFFYEPADSTSHAVICDYCGYVGLRPHEFNGSVCTLCGYN